MPDWQCVARPGTLALAPVAETARARSDEENRNAFLFYGASLTTLMIGAAIGERVGRRHGRPVLGGVVGAGVGAAVPVVAVLGVLVFAFGHR